MTRFVNMMSFLIFICVITDIEESSVSCSKDFLSENLNQWLCFRVIRIESDVRDPIVDVCNLTFIVRSNNINGIVPDMIVFAPGMLANVSSYSSSNLERRNAVVAHVITHINVS